MKRKLPIGAESREGGTHFRVWAPRRSRVDVAIEDPLTGDKVFHALAPEQGGYFAGLVSSAGNGSLYRFRLDSGDRLFPDPASRFQPQGPHGPSQVIEPSAFQWTDAEWRGLSKNPVIYEMHIGTFTSEGTWSAAAREIPELVSLGITLIEIMPVADFPGKFGWGYDGVDLFAPTRLYGTPDDFRRFIDRAHSCGAGVILDVVYNHLGPDGNYLKEFSPDYFTDRYFCEWGDAINFDGSNAAPVREFFLANVSHWISEYHLDGLRIDATQQIFDSSPRNIIAELSETARAAAGSRKIILVAENEPQHTNLIRPLNEGGCGLDALWNDDFHHTAMVALTGRREAYYYDYLGTPQEFVSALKWGYLYQGQYYAWQKRKRGTPSLGFKPESFINYIQNHDQVANTGQGWRIHCRTSPGLYRAITALLILGSGIPMLFQGQEFAASSPFLYFADHNPELAKLVKQGRMQFMSQFRSITGIMKTLISDPGDPETFLKSKLDFSERGTHQGIYAMHRDLLRIRATDPAFRNRGRGSIDGAVLGREAFILRYFVAEGRDRLLAVNLGKDINLDPAPEPLLAPPENCSWRLMWSSDNPKYGGAGIADLETGVDWKIPGWSSTFLCSEVSCDEL